MTQQTCAREWYLCLRFNRKEIYCLKQLPSISHDFVSNHRVEIVKIRHKRGSTIFASQFSPKGRHGKIGVSTLADAILDRIVHDSYTIVINGEGSMRFAVVLFLNIHLVSTPEDFLSYRKISLGVLSDLKIPCDYSGVLRLCEFSHT